MIFVTANSCRPQLERLTQFLLSAFPGSTVYQHTDMQRVPHDVLHNKVDAVFLAAEAENSSGMELMQRLHKQQPALPIYIISASENLRQQAVEAGADGYFVLTENGQTQLDTQSLLKTRNMPPQS